MTAFDLVHHDGSARYVSNQAPELGEVVVVRLRMPKAVQPDAVLVRSVADGEPRIIKAKRIRSAGSDSWWEAQLPIVNPLTRYRWLLSGGNVGYRWFHAAGHDAHDVTDAFDFSIVAYPEAPDWPNSSVVYQIFPDRFAPSDRGYDLPAWALPRSWATHPKGRGHGVSQEYFGGDLWGVIDRLDHLEKLGVTTLYFTPFFPAGSTHRYDANSFDHVDPLLGGDEALIALTAAAHARGLKVLGDLTLNHSGKHHAWFTAAQDETTIEREFYTFDDELEHGYECWFGVPSLPKFRYESTALRERLISGPHSVVRRWLEPPFSLDGWRIDVANMTGRQGATELNQEIARLTRETVRSVGDDKVLVAEHFHDAGPDLAGDGWQGTMNYSAFMKPVWAWLHDPEYKGDWLGIPSGIPTYDGQAFVETFRSFSARMPWRSLCASWNILSSHDTARIRTVVGSRERHIAALALQMTLPGVPMLFAGDELGMEGRWGEDSRRPYPWQSASEWDQELLGTYAEMAALRTSSSALAHGGLRWVHVSADVVAYLRESEDERLLVLVARAGVGDCELPLHEFDATSIESIVGFTATLHEGAMAINVQAPGVGIWRIA